jgi:hypothetical protein
MYTLCFNLQPVPFSIIYNFGPHMPTEFMYVVLFIYFFGARQYMQSRLHRHLFETSR